jgi:predicted metalloprotease with PDZ domain
MIKYTVKTTHPHRHFITFEAEFPTHGRRSISLQLPSWRPGRYELGNFAKNIRAWRATDVDGNDLNFVKKTKDNWSVETNGADVLILTYQYYAAELNAGSSFLDEDQLYINPVNCFFFDTENANANYDILLDVPEDYQVATGLKKISEHRLFASSFDELAESKDQL